MSEIITKRRKKNPKQKDNYFDNKLIEEKIAEYKIENNFKKRKDLEVFIMLSIKEIIKRIITFYNFTRFEEKEDLEQHAMEACFKSIKNFNPLHPKYSSAFNWFSLVSKRSLLNYTLRKRKHRGHLDIDDFFTLEYKNNELSKNFLEIELQNKLINLIETNFLGQQKTNYINLTYIIIGYLMKTKKFKKTDFYAWARSCGYNSLLCREYIKSVGKHIQEIINDTTDKER